MNVTRLRRGLLLIGLATTAWAGEPRNLSALKAEIVTYVDSGEYLADMRAAVAPALDFLGARAARRAPGERLAVVLDIDETVLSNLPQMRANDFGYLPAMWDAWVARGEAPVIEPVLAFYKAARAADVEVVFITGRKESDRSGTEKNLKAAGMGDYAGLWLKPNDGKMTTEQFKTETRRRLQAEGRVIIANLGDQDSDLAGGFAERTFKLPGPFYQTK
jgi:predicted secreted acid phosphatase